MEKDIALELYKIFRGQKTESIKNHQQALQRYLAFTVTILGATVAGIFNIQKIGWFGLVLIIGPFINISVSMLAIATCKRIYRAALNHICVTRKIESILGIDKYTYTKSADDYFAPFPEDKYIIPESWVDETRHRRNAKNEIISNYKKSDEFVKDKAEAGINKFAVLTFKFIIAINILIGITIVLTTIYYN